MIRVRAATKDDVPRMLEIARHSPTAARWNQAEYDKLFTAERPAGLVAMVIQENEQVMGFLAGRRLSEDEWELENLAISGSGRRRGLGSHLLGEFLKLVRDQGGHDVFLEMRASNRAAHALYEKWAFVEVGRRKGYYLDPPEDALVFRFSFPGEASSPGTPKSS